MELTVENMCGLLIRSKLLTSDGVRTMYARWQAESKANAGNVAQFSKWLVSNQYLTAYQSSLLARGYADNFFCNEYKILDRLGQGRMAGVYKAVHHLGQVVAIKVLPPSKVKDPNMFARFQREARLAIGLKHANIVRSFQTGEADGLHYIVMEYLDGETLEEVLNRRGKLGPAEGVRLIYQALMAAQHLHEQNLVHRDLKPSNMMLVPAAMRGGPQDNTFRATLKILDIGLGRAMFDESTSDSLHDHQLTGEGVLLGTPDYLAPEQARDAHKSDTRADIYSLGCVLYHVLTGQPPFPDTNIISQMVRHGTETPKPLKEFNPAVPDGLQHAISAMMAKHPAQRPQTPLQAAQALRPFMPPGMAEAVPMSEAEPTMKAYLKWLENKGSVRVSAPPPAVPVAALLSQPAAAAARPAPVAQADDEHSKPLRRRRKKHRRRERKHMPVASPGGELGTRELPARKTFGLTTRDWLFLGIGAASVLVAIMLGMWFGKRGAEHVPPGKHAGESQVDAEGR